MAIVFLALNGDGLGHLVRASLVCDALAGVGERPIIFSQGIFPLDARSRIAGTTVPLLWNASYRVRRSVALALNTAALMSQPSALVEDTHPGPLAIRAGIARTLLVRPTAFDELRLLRDDFSDIYRAFVLCDAPGSVSWPYTAEQTSAIRGWNGWHIVGPLYRTTNATEIAEVRARHRIDGDRRVCVFSMGGGGLHVPGDRDAETFVQLASRVAEEISRAGPPVRLLFVKGPYFPPHIEVGAPFEVIDREPLMPALLAAADGAVVRAGFNTPWECIAAGTPFMPFAGTTVNEPVAERVAAMRARGLLPATVAQFWLDETWRSDYRRACRAVVAEYPGCPDGRRLQALIVPPRIDTALVPARRAARPPRPPSATVPFVIRIDGVTAADPALRWLLDVLAGRRLRASLEVVPYLCELDASTLAAFDPDETLFDVGQHGYAGIIDAPEAAESERTLSEIDNGRRDLERAFAGRWKGGFSAPFDALPAGVRRVWCDRDGAFLSRRMTWRPAEMHGDAAAGIDVWDWPVNRPRTRPRMLRDLGRAAGTYGHVGLIVHPRTLRAADARTQLIAVLDVLQRRGVASTSLRAVAEGTGIPRGMDRTIRDVAWGVALAALGAPARDPGPSR